MKKPCPLGRLMQVIPVVALKQVKPPSTDASPYRSGVPVGSSAVSPAQTNWPFPEPPSSRP